MMPWPRWLPSRPGGLMRIDESAVARLSRLGEGNFGVVSRVSVKGQAQELALKEPLDSQGAANLSAMIEAVEFRAGLSPEDRDELDEFAMWPLGIVTRGGRPIGALMPLIPDDFYVHPSGGVQGGRVELNLSWFSAANSLLAAKGVSGADFADVVIRLSVLLQLVYAVGRLHRLGLVYGDVSLRNAVFALDPPRVLLMDCDSTASLKDKSRRQAHSPGFSPPESRGMPNPYFQDERTYVYKLALCIIRGLSRGRGATQRTTPDHLVSLVGTEFVGVLRQATDPDPGSRPTTKQLYAATSAAYHARLSPPVLISATLSKHWALRGSDVQISWQVTGATGLTIHGPNGLRVEPPPTGSPWSVTVCHSGEYRIVATSRHGEAHLVVGSVQAYELPNVATILPQLPAERRVLPDLRFPTVGTVALPSVAVERLPAIALSGEATEALGAMVSAISALPSPLRLDVDTHGYTGLGAQLPRANLHQFLSNYIEGAQALVTQALDDLQRQLSVEEGSR